MPKASRLLASIRNLGQACKRVSQTCAQVSMRCSQLSTTSSNFFECKYSVNTVNGDALPCSVRSNTVQIARPINSGSVIGASSTSQAPLGYSLNKSDAT